MAGKLTTANSVITLTAEILFPQAQRLEGFSADDIFSFDDISNGEFQMGIDGELAAGFVFNEIPFTITYLASSQSNDIFEAIYQYEVSNRTKLLCNMTVTLPSLGKRHDLKDGYVTLFRPAAGQKTLQPGSTSFIFSRKNYSNV